MNERTVVVLPTSNESETLAEMVGRLRARRGGADILIVDDASHDGTGDVADLMSARMPEIQVIHCSLAQGHERAEAAGIVEAIRRGYSVIVPTSHMDEGSGTERRAALSMAQPSSAVNSEMVRSAMARASSLVGPG